MQLPLRTELDLAGLSDEKVNRYPWIIAHALLRVLPSTEVAADLVRAVQVDAPPTVLAYDGNGRWLTLQGIPKEQHELRLWLLDYAFSRDMTIPYEVLKVWLDELPYSYSDRYWSES
jgi:hypothetical protein